MPYGGGVFMTQNKVLPGAYINFNSAARASAALSERGYVALALPLDWGPEDEVFTVGADDLQNRSAEIFGYSYVNDQLRGLRDLFRNARTAYLYRLNGGGLKAENAYAKALYAGIRGNALKIVIEPNEQSTENESIFDVSTWLDTARVDMQTVRSAAELTPNAYLEFIPDAVLELTAGTPLINGENGEPGNESYQAFLTKIESFAFNTLACLSPDDTVKGLYTAFTRRLRDDVGVKFQCVMHRCDADYEGIISVENNDTPDLVYWVAGAEAGCGVNASNTSKVYDGEYAVDTNYTQRQLEDGIKAGKLMFHRAYDKARVLTDINTLVTFTAEKGVDFASNQTMRVLDQIGNDIALMFNTRYLGKIPNDAAGRVSLWNDIVKHHQELETLRAIENFDPARVTVAVGDSKRAVAVTDYVTPVNAMEQLYMTVVVE